jgi:O-antigen/teichoic acid export membrane protein
VAVPLIVFARELVRVWVGSEYSTAAVVGVLLLATFPVQFANLLMGNVANATGRIRRFAIHAFVVQILNLALTLYLVGVEKLGAVGSALSTFCIMVLVYPVFMIPITLRLVGAGFPQFLRRVVLPGWLPGLLSLPLGFGVRYLLEPRSAAELVVGLACVAVSYLVFLLLFALRDEDRELVRLAWDSVRSRIPLRPRSSRAGKE